MSEAESEATAHSIQCKQKEQADWRICHNGKDKVQDWVTSQLKVKQIYFTRFLRHRFRNVDCISPATAYFFNAQQFNPQTGRYSF
jgi:hypothetical protein